MDNCPVRDKLLVENWISTNPRPVRTQYKIRNDNSASLRDAGGGDAVFYQYFVPNGTDPLPSETFMSYTPQKWLTICLALFVGNGQMPPMFPWPFSAVRLRDPGSMELGFPGRIWFSHAHGLRILTPVD